MVHPVRRTRDFGAASRTRAVHDLFFVTAFDY